MVAIKVSASIIRLSIKKKKKKAFVLHPTYEQRVSAAHQTVKVADCIGQQLQRPQPCER